MSSVEPRRLNLLRAALGLSLSGVAFYLAVRDVDFRQVAKLLSGVQPGYIILSLAGVALSHGLKVLRWRVLLVQQARRANLLNLLEALSIAQFFNIILPFRIGEISRLVLLGRRGLSRSFVLGTIVLEKSLDLLVFALLFMVLWLMLPLPGWVSQSGYILLALTLFISVALLAVMTWRKVFLSHLDRLGRFLPESWRVRLQAWLCAAAASLDVLHSRAAVIQLALASAAIWGAAILTNHMLFLAFDLDAPVTASLLVLVALQVVFSLPSAPGKLGIFEYICVLSLSVFAFDQPTALSYGILLHVIAYLPVIILGLVFLGSFGFTNAWDDLVQEKNL